MRKSLLRCLCGFTVAVIAVLSPAKARSDDVEVFTKFEVYLLFLSDLVPKSLAQNLSAAPVANDTRFGTATYVMSNIGATTEPGEPRFGGRMKRTVWGLLAPKRKAKVVIHTIGSDYDTALAVHTGDDVAALTKVAFNDNIAVPGISSVHSLVAFNALAGERYRVQVGSKTDEVGDAYVSLAMLPPAGGLSVTLVAVDGVPFGGRDYNCVIGNGEGNRCGAPTFLLYNSSKRKMRVTAKASLGAGLEVPSKAVLEPGTAATMTFGFAPGFDSATLRSKRGFFTFTAKRGKTFVQRVDVPGLIVVKDKAAGPDVLGAALRSAAVQAAPLQLAVPFELALTNHGSERAFGCHARVDRFVFSTLGRQLFTSDETADPAPATKPFAIAPGRTKTLPIQVAAMTSRAADIGFPGSGELRVDCANTAPLTFNLKNNFDFSARGSWAPSQVAAKIFAPADDVLSVPGTASLRGSVTNESAATASLRVSPIYAAPFSDSDLFTLMVCRLKAKNGACMAPPSFSVTYDAASGATNFFKVFVQAPANDPGFDPEARRIFLNVWQNKPDSRLPGTGSVEVATDSIAPRKD